MKKSLFVAAIAAISLVACKKTEATATEGAVDSVNATADSATNVIDSTTTATVDSVKAVGDSATAKVDATADAAKTEVKEEAKK